MNTKQQKESIMDIRRARASFTSLVEQQENKRDWKQAVSWLYHHEPMEEVMANFVLNPKQIVSIKEAVDILKYVEADYDKVHAWSVSDLVKQ